jgi:hypothetical protein
LRVRLNFPEEKKEMEEPNKGSEIDDAIQSATSAIAEGPIKSFLIFFVTFVGSFMLRTPPIQKEATEAERLLGELGLNIEGNSAFQ